MHSPSFYWYDYETFGIDPRVDRIAQFAGIRTDMDFNIIDDPIDIFCKATDDILPNPEACLITGITPQKTLATGLIEAEFIASILQQFATPNTCVVGFNSIRLMMSLPATAYTVISLTPMQENGKTAVHAGIL